MCLPTGGNQDAESEILPSATQESRMRSRFWEIQIVCLRGSFDEYSCAVRVGDTFSRLFFHLQTLAWPICPHHRVRFLEELDN
jgi:hypothetical protein